MWAKYYILIGKSGLHHLLVLLIDQLVHSDSTYIICTAERNIKKKFYGK